MGDCDVSQGKGHFAKDCPVAKESKGGGKGGKH